MLIQVHSRRGWAPLGAICLCAALSFVISGCHRASSAGASTWARAQGAADLTHIAFYKRYEKHMERDFFHHWRQQAYHTPNAAFGPPPTDSQTSPTTPQGQIFKELGPPNLVRGPFKSREGENVVEWIYLDRIESPSIYQFILNRLVYAGPMTDFEILLMTYGYPSDFTRSQIGANSESTHFLYDPTFSSNIRIYALIDNRLEFRQEND